MTLLITAAVLVSGHSVNWLIPVLLKDASLVDPFWSISFWVIALSTVLQSGFSPGKGLMLAAVALWALRLFAHLMPRFLTHKEEDPRYQAFREKYGPERYWWVSFFQVFLLQGTLALRVSAPLQVAGSASLPDPIGFWDILGVSIFVIGTATEAIADHQLNTFRADSSPDKPSVLDTGLWRYSRHPNYFGNALLWWGLGLMALDQPWGWLALLGPALMSFLLVKVSGVALLDAQLSRTRPGYKEYMARTSGFVPWFPKDA
jgi:steroid 5-alpha reductase family enzyme